MKTKHVLDQLSAYIDGQADRPDLIARHLQQCAECARRHMELSKLSAHIKALPPTETHPAFLTRVMANVVETKPVPRRRWLSWPASVAAAFLVSVVVGASYFAAAPHRSATPEIANTAVPGAPKQIDENALMRQIEERLALGGSTPLLESDDFAADSESDAHLVALLETTADDIERLARVERINDAGEDVEAAPMFEVTLDSLDDSDAAAFKELLSEYARKG
ncbi:MAG: hypothetical protein HZB26_18305 [Candidatus Hydrogenedentes bacterium]|nr:hypothetical protein [Candidatus Hydrogenedentota bacterium]